MQVNNMELEGVSKKKSSTEPAHMNRTDRSVQRSGIFGRQMMKNCSPWRRTSYPRMLRLYMAKIHSLANSVLSGKVAKYYVLSAHGIAPLYGLK